MANPSISQLGLELEYKCLVYESPDGSDSDESMNENLENLTPSETPPQVASPESLPGIERLSLGHVSSDNRAQSHRGRFSASGNHAISSKRAASSELPRRESPPSQRRDATVQRQHARNNVKGPSKQKGRSGPRHSDPRMKSTNQQGYLAWYGYEMQPSTPIELVSLDEARRPHPKPPLPQDSGYDTIPSRQATIQQPLQKMTNPLVPSHPRGHAPSPTPVDGTHLLAQVSEEAKGVVTRLAGPVPVLIDSRYPKLIMQHESSPISQDQLAAEVKGIYGGLVMVEAKCINIDAAQAADPNSKLKPEQWQALIALHRTLLYEHHDFLMATQHPSATSALSGLAQKYSMPARMWRHGIHAFLEVLRHRRPESQDYMLSFIYLAYQMMALLSETVPAFTDTWIECIGDLARYRMAIEEEKEAHSIWGSVAARWYNMASDRYPQIGRLYHHLGILERPSLRKMFLYARPLSCMIPFPNAQVSLGTLCHPIVQGYPATQAGMSPTESTIVSYYAHLFTTEDDTTISGLSSEILFQLSQQPSAKLKDIGASSLVTNIAAFFQLGLLTNQLWAYFNQAIKVSIQASQPSASALPSLSKGIDGESDAWSVDGTFADASTCSFCYSFFEHLMRRGKDRQSVSDILPSLHTTLVWLHSVFVIQSHANNLDDTINSLFDPSERGELCEILNMLIQYGPINYRIEKQASAGTFPGSEEKANARPKPLFEEYLIRGLMWCHAYFPQDWLSCQDEDDGRFFETPATHKARVERIQWLALFLASRIEYVKYDDIARQFCQVVPSHRPDCSAAELSIPPESEPFDWRKDKRPRTSSLKSRPSTKISANSDSEGYTVINKNIATLFEFDFSTNSLWVLHNDDLNGSESELFRVLQSSIPLFDFVPKYLDPVPIESGDSLTSKGLGSLLNQWDEVMWKIPQHQTTPKALKEDYLVRGPIWVQSYFPQDWFCEHELEDNERWIGPPMSKQHRGDQVSWLGMYLAGITDYIDHCCCSLRKKCERLACFGTSVKKPSTMLKYCVLGTCVRLVLSVPGTLAQELVTTATTSQHNLKFKGTPWYSDDPVHHALSYLWRLINPLLLLLPIGFGLVRITKAVRRSKDELKQSVYIRNFGLTTASIVGALQQLYDELDHAKLIIVFFWLWFLGEFLTISFRLIRAERQNAFVTGITVGTIIAAPTLASWAAQTSAGQNGSSTKQIIKLAIDMTPFIATCCTWGLYEAWRPSQHHRRQILPR